MTGSVPTPHHHTMCPMSTMCVCVLQDLTSVQNLQKKHALLEADVAAHQVYTDFTPSLCSQWSHILTYSLWIKVLLNMGSYLLQIVVIFSKVLMEFLKNDLTLLINQ